MTVGLLIFGGGAVGAGLAGSGAELIAYRGVQGLGAALVLPATLSIITNVFSREERARAIATWTAVGALGIGLGPALGGYLVDNYGVEVILSAVGDIVQHVKPSERENSDGDQDDN